jgi:hypothetical protein
VQQLLGWHLLELLVVVREQLAWLVLVLQLLVVLVGKYRL